MTIQYIFFFFPVVAVLLLSISVQTNNPAMTTSVELGVNMEKLLERVLTRGQPEEVMKYRCEPVVITPLLQVAPYHQHMLTCQVGRGVRRIKAGGPGVVHGVKALVSILLRL